jgi:hypothetical protein
MAEVALPAAGAADDAPPRPDFELVSVNIALLVTNIIVIERAFNLPGFFRVANIGQFGGLGDKEGAPSLDNVQALIVEASFLIAITSSWPTSCVPSSTRASTRGCNGAGNELAPSRSAA